MAFMGWIFFLDSGFLCVNGADFVYAMTEKGNF